MTKTKTLTLFNGRIIPGPAHGYIAAYSMADAIRIADESGYRLTYHEMREYWSKGAWGTPALAAIGQPRERCFWVFDEKKRIFERLDKEQKPIKAIPFDVLLKMEK